MSLILKISYKVLHCMVKCITSSILFSFHRGHFDYDFRFLVLYVFRISIAKQWSLSRIFVIVFRNFSLVFLCSTFQVRCFVCGFKHSY